MAVTRKGTEPGLQACLHLSEGRRANPEGRIRGSPRLAVLAAPGTVPIARHPLLKPGSRSFAFLRGFPFAGSGRRSRSLLSNVGLCRSYREEARNVPAGTA